MDAAVPAIVEIAAGPIRLEACPELGGAITAFYGMHEGRRLDWLRPATPEALAAREPLGMGSFPMIPFCNRIRGGRFTFEGKEVRMAANHARSRHALHGLAWQRSWLLEAGSDARIAMTLDHDPDKGVDPDSGTWPWRFSARQSYALAPDALTISMAVTNTGGVPMPLGFGHHPYFPRTARTSLRAGVSAMWATDDEVLPTRLEPGGVADRLAAGLPLAEADLDNNFTGWDGLAEIRWPERGAALRLTAGAPLKFLVVYAPGDQPLLAVEPVSNCTDWPNLRELGADSVGGMILEPGATAESWIRLEPRLEV
ncbi:aldose 1-epimerase [Arenibaculum pallidiluteum]|uniref:aldose 1-epimerase n=1 Tax=Arenibaculum pallidiluteum TaxID=2812559 RepID=UPI001A9690F7|nr:aldose 1-epimerase [Arenibaculum pallidiluteum]